MTKAEAVELARQEHEGGGHWHRDSIKLALLDRIHCPGLDACIVSAVLDCARCKGFGGTWLHSLLNPITRHHPFELLVGDYLSMPVGKGGFNNVGLYLDTYSQHAWGFMFKKAGSGSTTVKSLTNIFHNFAPSETFMTDGGPHFKCEEVEKFCEGWGTKTHVMAAYSPWVNGLVEGTNKLLLYILARLCAPELGEDGWNNTKWEDLPRTWPDHFDRAIRILNWRILPSLKFSPKELLLGLVVNTVNTPLEASASLLPPEDIDVHFAYAAQQCLNGYSQAVQHAIRRKVAFDKKVIKSQGGRVTFTKGQLVQVYRSDLANTLSTERKLTPMWSMPRRVTSRLENSYTLETLDGKPFSGQFSARRLREFIPREGTELAKVQKDVMAKAGEEEQRMAEEEKREVKRLREEDQEALKKMERVTDEWTAEEDLPGTGTEGEGNGYTEGTMEGPGWEGDSGEALGDSLQEVDEAEVDKAPTFFYEDGECELVEEEDIGIAGQVKAHHGTGGCQAARTPPS